MRGAPILILAGGGLLLYYLYSKGYLSHLGTTVTTTGTGTNTGASTGSTPSSNFNSLANIAARLQADVAANHEPSTLSVYQWNFYLNRNYSGPQPDSSAWNANNPNFDPSQPMTFAAYWSGAAPWLTANAGLSGFGIGVISWAA